METIRDTASPHERIGNFTLLRLLRMEEVTELWRAGQPSGPDVTLRRLAVPFAKDPRWRDELRIASVRNKRADHFNIPWSLGWLEFDGQIIQIVEDIHAVTMQDILDWATTYGAPVPRLALLWVVREVLAATIAAASRGYEHGLIKAEYIYVTRLGDIRLDYGVVGEPLEGDDLLQVILLLDRFLAHSGDTTQPTLAAIVQRGLVGAAGTPIEVQSALDRCFYAEFDGDDLKDGRAVLAKFCAPLLPDPDAPPEPTGPGEYTKMMMARERPVEPLALTLNDRATGGHDPGASTWSPGQVIRGEHHDLPPADPGPVTEPIEIRPVPRPVVNARKITPLHSLPPPTFGAGPSAYDVPRPRPKPVGPVQSFIDSIPISQKIGILLGLLSVCFVLAALTAIRHRARDTRIEMVPAAAPAPQPVIRPLRTSTVVTPPEPSPAVPEPKPAPKPARRSVPDPEEM